MWIQRRGQAIRRGNNITVNGRPFIIGIGGSHSGVGKTTVAEALLKHFSLEARKRGSSNLQTSELSNFRSYALSGHGWGAIKYTRTAIYSSIVDDLPILRQKNKDTERLLNAGAENVLWVQSPDEGLKEVMHLAVNRLSHLRGIIIEGNSAIEFLKPDVVIFILGKEKNAETLKKSAVKVLNMADIILFQHEPAIKLPVRAKKFKVSISPMSGLDECINYINGMTR